MGMLQEEIGHILHAALIYPVLVQNGSACREDPLKLTDDYRSFCRDARAHA